MNWDVVSFDWNHARAFLVTAEEGSLSAAARALGLTQPTLGRQVSALEQELDVILFERIGKNLVLTDTGLELLEHMKKMYEAANQVSLSASGQSQAIEGRVRITAGDIMSAFTLPKALQKIREVAPRLQIEIVASNEIRDLQLREADIAIRHVRPEQPELISKLIRQAEGYFYASKTYLDQTGRPETKEELKNHAFIGLGDNARMISYLHPHDIFLSEDNFRFSSENGIVAWEMAKHDLGIIPMSHQMGASDNSMEQVLPEMEAIKFPIWLTAHRELHSSRRIRLVFDLLSEYLKNEGR